MPRPPCPRPRRRSPISGIDFSHLEPSSFGEFKDYVAELKSAYDNAVQNVFTDVADEVKAKADEAGLSALDGIVDKAADKAADAVQNKLDEVKEKIRQKAERKADEVLAKFEAALRGKRAEGALDLDSLAGELEAELAL